VAGGATGSPLGTHDLALRWLAAFLAFLASRRALLLCLDLPAGLERFREPLRVRERPTLGRDRRVRSPSWVGAEDGAACPCSRPVAGAGGGERFDVYPESVRRGLRGRYSDPVAAQAVEEPHQHGAEASPLQWLAGARVRGSPARRLGCASGLVGGTRARRLGWAGRASAGRRGRSARLGRGSGSRRHGRRRGRGRGSTAGQADGEAENRGCATNADSSSESLRRP
jgi:hypothetical protein